MTFRPRALALVAALALTAGAVAGCTAPEPSPTPSTTATDGANQDPGVTDIRDAPGTGEGLEGALADSTTDTCERTGDAWSITGTVTNSTEGVVDYRIYVSLLDGSNSTRGLQQVDVSQVEPGATSEWSSELAVAEDDLTCVLRVERYAAPAEPGTDG